MITMSCETADAAGRAPSAGWSASRHVATVLNAGGTWRRRLRCIARFVVADMLVLAMLLVATGLAAGFLAIASEMVEGETVGFDKAILTALRNPSDLADPIGPPWLEQVMRDVTALGGVTVVTLVTLATLGFLLVSRRYRIAALVLSSIIGGSLMSSGLKAFFARPRPDLVAHVVEVNSLSFPSGHATLSAVTYLTLGALLATTQTEASRRGYILGIAVLLTLMIGVSRIYLGVHYPTDVLAGWSIGAAWAIFCLGLDRSLRRATN